MEERFLQWSSLHHLILIITISLLALLIFLGRSNSSQKPINQIGYAIGAILILNYIVYVIYRVKSGYWEIRYDLPMELCNWSMIVTALALFTHNRTFAELSYFWVMSGSVNGVITPDLQVTFPHIYFFIFFIAHSGLVIGSLFIVFGLKLYPRKWSVLRTILYTELFFITAFVVDLLLDGNYAYIMAKPSSGSILDYLGEWPYYLVNLQILGVVLFFILYVPFYFKNKNEEIE
ncbi:TIGR02206 family membrane protein [Leptospira perolatii]|uniref:TIGR02206 family membrane protein n=1 Tax=Leptospira perolatii TaxID=2023191 RepID=A0A2M9ZNX9_9LEPT|nr:TIGR02206 family membrane protein [Leptospira perolatii]PJZ70886.1 TIGR02206 family membrane protein [Leptospira perolatii]PJZ73782.1 TIGR02206 family membrane protein [Leptospira perolatii]